MRYSLTSLLLEDTEFQGFNLNVLPSDEEAKKIAPFTVLGLLKGAGSLIAGSLGSKMIDWVVLHGSPRCAGIVKQARGYAKRRDRDVKLMLGSSAYEDFIRAVYTDRSRYTDDQRKSMSVCLGLYEDPLVGTRPWQGTTDINGVSPDDVITQGCRDMKSAAAIAAYSDMTSNIHKMSTMLQKCMRGSTVGELAKEFGVNPESINIDLTEDKVIAGIIQKAEDARELFEKEMDIEGREPFFANQSLVSARISGSGATVADICPPDPTRGSPGVLPESMRPRRVMREAARDTDAPARTALEALDAFKSKSPENIRFVQDVAQRTGINRPQDLAQIGSILRAGKATGLKNIQFKFPKKEDEDYRLGGATVLSAISPSNFTLERVAAGLVVGYLAGFRPKGVSAEVLQLIVDTLAPGVANVSTAGEVVITAKNIGKQIVTALADKRSGLRNDLEKQAAMNLVLYHLIVYGERRSGRDRGRRGMGGVPTFDSMARSSYENIFGFHALADLEKEGMRSDNIVFAPGRKDPTWYERLTQSVRGDKGAPKYMTSIRMRPNIEIAETEEELEQFPELPEDESTESSAARREVALRNIDLMWKQVRKITSSIARSTTKLGENAVDPVSSGGGGQLPLLEYFIDVARKANHFRTGFGAGADLIGFSYPDVLVVGQGEVSPEDVLKKLSDIAGIRRTPRANVAMTHRHAVAEWSPELQEEFQTEVLPCIHKLIVEQFVYPAGCIVKAVADGYARDKVISQKDADKIYKKFFDFRDQILQTVERFVRAKLNTVQLRSFRRIKNAGRNQIATIVTLPNIRQHAIDADFKSLSAKNVQPLYDDAPRVIDIASVLTERPDSDDTDSAPSAGPTAPPPAAPPAAPPPAPTPTPPAPAAPATPSSPGITFVNYTVHQTDPEASPSNVPDRDDMYSVVRIKTEGVTVIGTVYGSPSQSASAIGGGGRLPKYEKIVVSGMDVAHDSPRVGEIRARVTALGGEATISQIVDAIHDVSPESGLIHVDLTFGHPQSSDD